MNKLDNYAIFQQPKPVEAPSCVSCKAFRPECLVPSGDGAVGMCWLCAHHHVDHEVSIAHAYTSTCNCKNEEIYPKSVIEARRVAS